MNNHDKYEALSGKLSLAGIKCVIMRPHQLVIASEERKSAWLTIHQSQWFMITWTPEGYKINEADIEEICKSFLSSPGTSAHLPESLVRKYGLSKLSESELDEILDEEE